MARLKHVEPTAGLGFGLSANWAWFWRQHRKILAFDEGVFIFMLSAALIFDQLVPMLWIFAASQLFWGTYKSWRRGQNISRNQKIPLRK
jgi:hypothetical protein